MRAVYNGFCKPQSCQKQKDNYSTAVDVVYIKPWPIIPFSKYTVSHEPLVTRYSGDRNRLDRWIWHWLTIVFVNTVWNRCCLWYFTTGKLRNLNLVVCFMYNSQIVSSVGATLNGANLYGYVRCKMGSMKNISSAATNFLGKQVLGTVWLFLNI